jgi:hypothetical protein
VLIRSIPSSPILPRTRSKRMSHGSSEPTANFLG